MGTLIAWVLVRERFRGAAVLEIVIDIPFALPTIVAGLVLLALYGTDSPVGVNLLGTGAGCSSRCCSSRCRSWCAPCSRC